MDHHLLFWVSFSWASMRWLHGLMGISEGEFLNPESISDTLKCPATWNAFSVGKGMPNSNIQKLVRHFWLILVVPTGYFEPCGTCRWNGFRWLITLHEGSWVRPFIQVAKVCFEVFDDPVFCGGRPCQHVFCRACVEQCLVAESSSQDAASQPVFEPTSMHTPSKERPFHDLAWFSWSDWMFWIWVWSWGWKMLKDLYRLNKLWKFEKSFNVCDSSSSTSCDQTIRPSSDNCPTKKTHPKIQWLFQSIMGLIKASTYSYHHHSDVALFHEQASDTSREDSEEKLHTSGAVGHCPTCRAQMHLEDLHPHQVGPKWIDGSMNTCERVVVSTSVVDVSCQHSITEPRVAVFGGIISGQNNRNQQIKIKAWHDMAAPLVSTWCTWTWSLLSIQWRHCNVSVLV